MPRVMLFAPEVGMMMVVAWALGSLTGCAPVDDAGRTFDEALHEAYVVFDGSDEELAPVLRNLESRMYQDLWIDDGDVTRRSVSPSNLSQEEVAVVSPRPAEADPANTMAVAVAYPSPHGIGDHRHIPVLEDQRPVEPQSPDFYEREFLEGKSCWMARDCALLRTFNTMTKVYTLGLLPPLTYSLYKDYRWVDLNADRRDEDPRWAYVGRTWNPESFGTEDERNVIVQSYTYEVWFPRDGGGFLWEEADPERPATQGDSSVGGTLRMMVIWSEAKTWISSDPAAQEPVVRGGTNDIFRHQDGWLDQPGNP